MKGKGTQVIPADDRLILEISGGGGLGDPAERDPALSERDRQSAGLDDRKRLSLKRFGRAD